MSKSYGTENCIVCGEPARIFRGHVIAKEKMALGNLIDMQVLAGFCSNECNNTLTSDENGCFGTYSKKMGLVEDIFTHMRKLG